ncbi:uncharacterized protein K452DRAFT_50336 [Aplosporella prunicola CBS 121167]|uniref:Uncharacterized protein n=1 Tax=Aplosporella prunicola CBS 121167 TaxID=1176127 RepID=A0A6A6BAU3_9PEZI|nr:uncharacterized protein K452DRAFT_50336 [Aplosporella prunicola CBS 121167]KAF2140708.1 hypothetical protein K452DRAFT_50336 [Aplosporella prunicola CBS 121167]
MSRLQQLISSDDPPGQQAHDRQERKQKGKKPLLRSAAQRKYHCKRITRQRRHSRPNPPGPATPKNELRGQRISRATSIGSKRGGEEGVETARPRDCAKQAQGGSADSARSERHRAKPVGGEAIAACSWPGSRRRQSFQGRPEDDVGRRAPWV